MAPLSLLAMVPAAAAAFVLARVTVAPARVTVAPARVTVAPASVTVAPAAPALVAVAPARVTVAPAPLGIVPADALSHRVWESTGTGALRFRIPSAFCCSACFSREAAMRSANGVRAGCEGVGVGGCEVGASQLTTDRSSSFMGDALSLSFFFCADLTCAARSAMDILRGSGDSVDGALGLLSLFVKSADGLKEAEMLNPADGLKETVLVVVGGLGLLSNPNKEEDVLMQPFMVIESVRFVVP